MQFKFYSAKVCKFHNETFTNMCIDTKCLQPLCPECIEVHLREHKDCSIESLKQCKSQCQRKINSAIEEMNQILNVQEMYTLNHQNEYIELCKQRMQQIKQTIVIQIDHFLQEKLQELYQQLSNTYQDLALQEVHTRITNLINQLQELFDKLDQSYDYQLDTMKSIFLLNTKQLIHSSTQEAKKEINKLKFPLLNINTTVNMNELLSSNIQIQIKDQILEPPKIESWTPQESQLVQQNKPIQKTVSNLYLQQQSAFLQKRNLEFAIKKEDYFKQFSQQKQLHYFHYNSTELYLIPLNKLNDIIKIQLKINFKIPVFHQSISTENGQIYLLGGSIVDTYYPNNKSNLIYIFDKGTLIIAGSLITGRSSHGCTILGEYIYSISGMSSNQKIEKRSERFNFITRKSEQIQDCLYPSIACCCINFQNEYLYKFGGIYDNKPINTVERFNIKDMIWQSINVDILNKDAPIYKGFLQFSAGLQISDHFIMIFGGYDHNQQSSNYSLLIQIKDQQHIIQRVNHKPLILNGGFWHQECIIHNQEIYALINQEKENGEISETKQVLKFSDRWYLV